MYQATENGYCIINSLVSSLAEKERDICSITNQSCQLLDDPAEEIDLHDILPEQVEILEEMLQDFLRQAHLGGGELASAQATTSDDQLHGQNDPQVQRRLHDLGYVE